MNKVSNSKLLKIFTNLLILTALAKMFSLGLWWYLPSDGVELNVRSTYAPKYQRVDFKNMLSTPSTEQQSSVATANTNSGISITNMILKGLYGTKTKGYVIIAMKSNPKQTSIIAIGEDYNGYKLKSISRFSALFERFGKDYVLELEKMEKGSAQRVKKVVARQAAGVPVGVSRNDINYFAKNPQKIWQQIAIDEVRENGKIKGFKVVRIDPNSKFAALGLEKGDLIIKANNITLKSYKDAIEIYKNIDKVDAMEIVVLRNNQEKELVYEIH